MGLEAFPKITTSLKESQILDSHPGKGQDWGKPRGHGRDPTGIQPRDCLEPFLRKSFPRAKPNQDGSCRNSQCPAASPIPTNARDGADPPAPPQISWKSRNPPPPPLSVHHREQSRIPLPDSAARFCCLTLRIRFFVGIPGIHEAGGGVVLALELHVQLGRLAEGISCRWKRRNSDPVNPGNERERAASGTHGDLGMRASQQDHQLSL